ncbi:MAG: transposase [Hyphomicrobiales bacterium]|nr:transposase [Hyphomicrobiales bacterium]
MSRLDDLVEPTSVHRLEVISGSGRRRSFTDEFKARVVEETLARDAVVSRVARRHGLSPQQVFTWRRQAREASRERAADTPMFVPAVIEEPPARRTRTTDRSGGVVEIEIGSSVVRVSLGADVDTLAAVIAALKRAT